MDSVADLSEEFHDTKSNGNHDHNVSEIFSRKRRKRTTISAEQLLKLEDLYKKEQWPGREKKEDLAHQIGMSTHFVNIWFQNKRSRMKKLVQEEEELRAIKKRLPESDSNDSKATPGVCSRSISVRATKRPHATATEPGRKDQCTLSPGPTVSAQVRPIRPMPVNGSPYVALGSSGLGGMATLVPRLTRLPFPVVPKNTFFTSVPLPAYHLRSIDKSSRQVTSKSRSIATTTSTPSASRDRISSMDTSRTRSRTGQMDGKKRIRLQVQGTSTMPCHSTPDVAGQHHAGKTTQEFNVPLKPAKEQPTLAYPPTADQHDERFVKKQTVKCTQGQSSVHSTASCKVPRPPDGTTLLRCLILMMALAESPGTVPPGTQEFDLAVRACLYGVKIDDGKYLTYDKQFGFRIEKSLKKNKKGKKMKKKRRLGRKK